MRHAFTFVFALLLLLAGFVNLTSAYTNPITFLQNETKLIAADESMPEYLEISFEKEVFHVVKVMSGNEPAGLIAIDKTKEEVVKGDVTLKKLFITYGFYDNFNKFKKNLQSLPSADWFITKGKIAQNLATALAEEENDLIIVDNQLDDAKVHSLISKLKSSLSLISTKTFILSDILINTNDTEVTFLSKPFVGGEKKVKDSIIEALDAVTELDTYFLEYKTEIDSLKKYIGTLNLAIETKKSLNNVLEPPENFSIIGNWAYNASDFKNSVESAYKNAVIASTDLVNSFKIRLQREKSYEFLYGENASIKKEFGETYNSIAKAVAFILAKENVFKWKASDIIPKMKKDWSDAEEYFKKNQFDKAENSADKARLSAIQIHKQGFKEEDEEDEQVVINYDLLFTGAVGIIILLIILIVIRNRKKFFSFLRNEEESIDAYEFK